MSSDVGRTRRAVLTAAASAAAIAAASAIARPLPVDAATDSVSYLNDQNANDVLTANSKFNSSFPTFSGQGIGVHGLSSASYGVKGESGGSYGVYGDGADGVYGVAGPAAHHAGVIGANLGNGTGVFGFSTSNGQPQLPPNTGVFGYTDGGTGAKGVYGLAAAATGYSGGVSGQSASSGGVGVWGNSVADSTGTMGVTGPTDPGPIAMTGVFGVATQTSGATRGLVGQVLSAAGVGITGVVGGSLPPVYGNIGVHGLASSGLGVLGQSTTNWGVHGVSGDSIGVRADSSTGTALQAATSAPNVGIALHTIGRVLLDNSAGVATVAAGKSSVVVTPGIDLTATSAVVATLQGNPGGKTTVQRVAVNATADTFTIYLTGNATKSVKVAWHVFG